MIKKFVLGVCLALLSYGSLAQSCNRTRPDDGDYVEHWEFCDDDISRRKVPAFKDFPADTARDFKPVFPTRVGDSDGDDNAAWLKRVEETYRSGAGRFAGHYLIAERGGCGAGCNRAIIVDLLDGKTYQPKELRLVDSSVNPLPETMCKKLDMNCSDIIVFRPESKLLLVIGDLGLVPDMRGLYHFQWDENKLKLVSKVERSPSAKPKGRSK